jgi:hypothetical protein
VRACLRLTFWRHDNAKRGSHCVVRCVCTTTNPLISPGRLAWYIPSITAPNRDHSTLRFSRPPASVNPSFVPFPRSRTSNPGAISCLRSSLWAGNTCACQHPSPLFTWNTYSSSTPTPSERQLVCKKLAESQHEPVDERQHKVYCRSA